ncbi:MAG: hypothetical protein IKQ70_05250 [Bacteroidales bacterium]|nr:hypothetical protein [Bacteroidales bacterium]
MTATQLRTRIDNTMQKLTEKQLYVIYTVAEAFASEGHHIKSKQSDLPPKNPKLGGRRISDEIAAMFLTGNSLDVTDEELEQMKYDYLIEKYG